MKLIKKLDIFFPKTVENNPQSHIFFIRLGSKFKGSGFKGLKFRSCSVSTTPVKHKEGLTPVKPIVMFNWAGWAGGRPRSFTDQNFSEGRGLTICVGLAV